jgi:hypothetical protein
MANWRPRALRVRDAAAFFGTVIELGCGVAVFARVGFALVSHSFCVGFGMVTRLVRNGPERLPTTAARLRVFMERSGALVPIV